MSTAHNAVTVYQDRLVSEADRPERSLQTAELGVFWT